MKDKGKEYKIFQEKKERLRKKIKEGHGGSITKDLIKTIEEREKKLRDI